MDLEIANVIVTDAQGHAVYPAASRRMTAIAHALAMLNIHDFPRVRATFVRLVKEEMTVGERLRFQAMLLTLNEVSACCVLEEDR